MFGDVSLEFVFGLVRGRAVVRLKAAGVGKHTVEEAVRILWGLLMRLECIWRILC